MTTTATKSRSASSGTDETTLTVLIADKFEPAGLEAMRKRGFRVEFEPDLNVDTMAESARRVQPDVLIVRSTKVRADALDASSRLSLIIRAGAGYDSIDVAGASARGIFVANCPGKNALAVAELTWALILACDRRVPDQTAELRQGIWNKKEFAKARGIYGRTLGIVGLGTIGHAVVERARGFGMNIVAWSRRLTPEDAERLGIEFCATPRDVAAQSDIVTLHVASTPETKGLVDDAFCDALKPGAYLINTTRGAVVDQTALTKAIREKGIRVGLDVYANEPAAAGKRFEDPIVQETGVYGTHHVGASTDQAQDAIGEETVRVLEVYAATGEVSNCVNRAAASPATCLLTVRHLNRAGVLAHVFHVLSAASINVEEMENIIYEGAEAACARIRLDSTPTPSQLESIGTNEHILSVNLTRVP